MLVTWVTLQPLQNTSFVEFGLDKAKLASNATAESFYFQQGIANFTTHRALLTQLKPVTKYCKCTFYYFTKCL